MNGPEHYREAERLLDIAQSEMERYGYTSDQQEEAYHLQQATWAQQRAQVHATLALAAATAAQQATAYDGDEHGTRSRGWAGVA